MAEAQRDWSKVNRGVNEGVMGRPTQNRHGPRNTLVMVRVTAAEKEWLDARKQDGESIAAYIRRCVAAQCPPDSGLFVDTNGGEGSIPRRPSIPDSRGADTTPNSIPSGHDD